MTRVIEIIVSPQGETRIETKGFSGSSCREATRSLEQALGIKAAEKLTSEFYAASVNQQQIREGQA